MGPSSISCSTRRNACVLSCRPLVTGRSQGSMMSRTLAFEVALDIVPVDADAARSAEEALELGKPHHWHGCLLMCMPPCHGELCRPASFEGEPDGHRALADG